MDGISDSLLVASAGFAGGALLGLAARLGRFCMMGAVEDAVLGGDLGRIRMVALAAAIAIAGTFGLIGLGLLDPAETRYFHLEWSPAGAVIGGLLFGFGMSQVGTCGFGALARIGGGDLRSVVMVMVLGIAAYATLAGPLSGLRLMLAPAEVAQGESQGLAHIAGALVGVSPLVPGFLAAAALAGWVLLDARFRRPSPYLLWPFAVGAAVMLGWFATAWVARTGFEALAVESFSFAAPMGEALIYIMTSAGTAPGFGVGAVAGVIAGAVLGSAIKGESRWEACDDARELRRQMAGAAMMGVGGVLALGCTVGQGLTAMSLLTVSAPVVVVSILAGARLGLYLLVEGTVFGQR